MRQDHSSLGSGVLTNPHVDIPTPRQNMRDVVKIIATGYGITAGAIYGDSRAHKVVCARHSAMVALRHLFPQYSYMQIGRHFNRDHTTIMYAVGARSERHK